ncbi:MAG: arginine--tRNA ligase [Candidatus Saccharibacteria bacterium]
MEEIKQLLTNVCKQLFDLDIMPELTRPDVKFGDYTTNIALVLSAKLNKTPRDVAVMISDKIDSTLISKVDIAGPGFLNISLTDDALVKTMISAAAKPLLGQVAVVEYSDPNPFKVLHAGHLYTSVVGDAIANLLETAGATVHRVNFGGDVGRHVAQTMWAIIDKLGGENPEKLSAIAENERAPWMAECYISGTAAFETNEDAKQLILELNKKIYAIHANKDHDSALSQIYWTCRTWSYDYFDAFYERIGSHFEKYYPESEVADLGLTTVKEQLSKGVFEQSDGAVVFAGEKHGLHTRVFINSQGLPTYETKDVGLIMTKWNDYHFDKSVVITGNEIEQYMSVVLKAIEQFAPELVKVTSHLTHGMVKLKGGIKMSSRLGNILRAVDVLDAAAEANQLATGKNDVDIELGAVKYAFLKQRTGGDIIFDPESSIKLEGNSGPYLQYAHARARSILSKKTLTEKQPITNLEGFERDLTRKVGEYQSIVSQAVTELMPHYICTYLYELAQVFNRFYEQNKVIDDPRENIRLQLVEAYANTLRSGLDLLSISAPEQM